MAQTPKGRLVQGLYKPIYGTCAMYFYLGVYFWTFFIFLTLGLKVWRLELKGSLLVSDMSEVRMDNDPGAE